MAAALHILPRRYLNVARLRPITQDMPIEPSEEIRLENNAETRKAWRIASMIHSANVLSDAGFHAAAQHLRMKAAALKYSVPEPVDSAPDEDWTDDTSVDITIVADVPLP